MSNNDYTWKSIDYLPNGMTVKERNDLDHFRVAQDIQAYRAEAARQRELDTYGTKPKTHYKPFAIIPDIVAIDILTKHGINIHAPEFMHDTAAKNKLKNIIMTEYPDLLTSNIRK